MKSINYLFFLNITFIPHDTVNVTNPSNFN